jgi:hypothetical protein
VLTCDSTTVVIGCSGKSVSLSRAPGWEPESYGYHGDDGHVFASQSVGKAYGPKYGPGDTVGCLVNFRTGTVNFTKNGDDLGKSCAFLAPFSSPRGVVVSSCCRVSRCDTNLLLFSCCSTPLIVQHFLYCALTTGHILSVVYDFLTLSWFVWEVETTNTMQVSHSEMPLSAKRKGGSSRL